MKYQEKWYYFSSMRRQFCIKLVLELKQIISRSDFFFLRHEFNNVWLFSQIFLLQKSANREEL